MGRPRFLVLQKRLHNTLNRRSNPKESNKNHNPISNKIIKMRIRLPTESDMNNNRINNTDNNSANSSYDSQNLRDIIDEKNKRVRDDVSKHNHGEVFEKGNFLIIEEHRLEGHSHNIVVDSHSAVETDEKSDFGDLDENVVEIG